MPGRIKVSAVSYLNTAPFVYGLKRCDIKDAIDLVLDYPAECARKTLSGESHMGLVPLASIVNRKDFNIITDYCIGANDKVRTVALLSNVGIDEIDTIYLDYQSLTSVTLIKILAKHHWKRDFVWKPFGPGSNYQQIHPSEGVVAIGDKVFELESHFKMSYDLAEHWISFTGFPMVFAVWTTREQFNHTFIDNFNKALQYGIDRIPEAVDFHGPSIVDKDEAVGYLTNNISFELGKRKRESIHAFGDLAKEFLI